MLLTLALLACIGAGTVGGVFFAFSTFVMKALTQLPASQGVAAMQRINVVVLNPLFLGVFVGTAFLSAASVVAAFFPWSTSRSPWLMVAGLLYLVGSFFVTRAFNIPRNERLARLDAESAEAAGYWPLYVREWSYWNHLRTAASLASAVAFALVLGSACTVRQSGTETVEAHVAAARAAAGSEHTALLDLCEAPEPDPPQQTPAPATMPGPPSWSEWHMEPVKVFDNLYFVGQKDYSAWAITTSAGIIVMDALWDYSVEDEIVGGLQTLGLDPKTIRYVVVSHAHIDHAGGAKYLQDRFGARVILSAADWDLLAKDPGPWPKPRRDLIATDGQRLTLGDTTLTFYLTPGHTPGTISTLIPVRDGGKPHLAAEWGGTGFNFTVSSDRPESFWFTTYSQSAKRFRDIVRKTGADVVISNHPSLDGSTRKLPALAKRRPGDPHPYVIGNAAVARYLTVADECAKAGLLRLSLPQEPARAPGTRR